MSSVDCSVCLEALCNPISYQCGHTVCQSCHFKMTRQGPVLCPLCRVEVSAPASCMVNVLLNSLLRGEISPAQLEQRPRSREPSLPSSLDAVLPSTTQDWRPQGGARAHGGQGLCGGPRGSPSSPRENLELLKKRFGECVLPNLEGAYSLRPFYVEFSIGESTEWTAAYRRRNGAQTIDSLAVIRSGRTLTTGRVHKGYLHSMTNHDAEVMPKRIGMLINKIAGRANFYNAETGDKLHIGPIDSSNQIFIHKTASFAKESTDPPTIDSYAEDTTSAVPPVMISDIIPKTCTMDVCRQDAIRRHIQRPTFISSSRVLVSGDAFFLNPDCRDRGGSALTFSAETYSEVYVELHMRMQQKWVFGIEGFTARAYKSDWRDIEAPDGSTWMIPSGTMVDRLGLYFDTRSRVWSLYCTRPRSFLIGTCTVPANLPGQRIAVGFSCVSSASDFGMMIVKPV
ncbi:protein ORF150 [Cyprinid herpesvirus 1]|uniref:Protein ORF150 n=1 Tax=Cyprinid herpesvirus 1 TaxID=317858 RepID=K7PCA3_9VIRU|nr:protein ORF150 [Cyprinid herpesvirus 1]AFJ20437.1 protein ORF150 [Cyprinid herpesvirus 1]